MIVVKNPQVCTGCLICELACSFHNIHKYSRSFSSIRVDKPLLEHGKGTSITIYRNKQGSHPACNLCKQEQIPLCIRFCPENVFQYEGGKS